MSVEASILMGIAGTLALITGLLGWIGATVHYIHKELLRK